MNGDDFFKGMTKEAIEELVSGRRGTWRDVTPNVLILACFGMLTNHLSHRIVRPLWFFALSVGAGVIWTIVKDVIG